VGPDLIVDKDDLWSAWKEWCSEEGAHPGTKAVFVGNLRASLPDAIPQRPTRNGRRVHVIAGLEVGPTADPVSETPDGGKDRESTGAGFSAQPRDRSAMSGVPLTVTPTRERD
jgi:hypothetical protein